jgi:hypothetical protein
MSPISEMYRIIFYLSLRTVLWGCISNNVSCSVICLTPIMSRQIDDRELKATWGSVLNIS